jgi:hypothetical protein
MALLLHVSCVVTLNPAALVTRKTPYLWVQSCICLLNHASVLILVCAISRLPFFPLPCCLVAPEGPGAALSSYLWVQSYIQVCILNHASVLILVCAINRFPLISLPCCLVAPEGPGAALSSYLWVQSYICILNHASVPILVCAITRLPSLSRPCCLVTLED